MGLAYIGIRVKDLKKSQSFYTRTVGMKFVERRDPVPGEATVMLLDPQTKQRLRLLWYDPRRFKPFTPYVEDGVELDHLLFRVPDAEKAYKRLVKKGCPVAMKFFEGKTMRLGFAKDPNGIWVGVASELKKKTKQT